MNNKKGASANRSRVFFTADTHLDHSNIIKYCNRPFMSPQEIKDLEFARKSGDPKAERRVSISHETVERMNAEMLNRANETVMPQDTLYIIGDFAWVKTRDRAKYFRDAINCRNVILIWGNHDNRQLLKGLFQGYYDILDTKIDTQHIVMCHYALQVWNRSHYGSYHIFGHTHDKLKSKLGTLSVDIGVDGWNFTPVAFEQIVDVMSKKDILSGEKGYF